MRNFLRVQGKFRQAGSSDSGGVGRRRLGQVVNSKSLLDDDGGAAAVAPPSSSGKPAIQLLEPQRGQLEREKEEEYRKSVHLFVTVKGLMTFGETIKVIL